MNCPYCKRLIKGMTGLQEAQALQRHLNRCPKTPRITDGEQTVVLHKHFDLNDALRIRAESGQ